MLITLSGMITDVNLLSPSKADFPILVTGKPSCVAGIVTLFDVPAYVDTE